MMDTPIIFSANTVVENLNVAQIHHSFFAKSETFIYQIVSNLKKFHPLFIAWEFQNLDQFPGNEKRMKFF